MRSADKPFAGDRFGGVCSLSRQTHLTQGADPAFLGADEFAKYLASEMPRWADAVGKSGAKLD